MTKKRKTRNKPQPRPLLLRGIKWLFVLGLWCGIALTLLTAWYATELPGIIESPQIERSTAITVTAANGETLARYGQLKGMSVDMEDLPSHLVYAVMAVEDRRFYDHFGIDPIGLARAMARNLKEGRVVQGGSTITQQLAKNLFLSPERTIKRKIQEALLALWLERELTKDEILTAYLNRVYLGAGTYGVDAAARTYFNKAATDISLYESAMLAGLLKAPSRYSPHNNPAQAARRTKVVLAAMADAGYITEEQATAQSIRAQASLPKPSVGQGERYFTDWVISNLDEMIGTPANNLIIQTTLDPQIQNAAEEALATTLRQNKDRKVTQGAIMVMDRDGAILAMVGGAEYSQSQFNRATQAKRPPGSAFKPIVYLAALEAGWKPYDKIPGTPITEGDYRPENFDGEYKDEVTLTEALAQSLNTASVRLTQYIDVKTVIRTARRLGINSELKPNLSLALGSSGISLFEMMRAYGILANGGAAVTPYSIIKITDDKGNLLYINAPAGRQRDAAASRDVHTLQQMLREAIDSGTGGRARLPYPASGKTGTSQDYRDAWFIGFTDRYVAGVWLGNDDNSPMQGVTGGSLPAEIWRDVMLATHQIDPDPVTQVSVGSTVSDFFSMLGRLLQSSEQPL